MKIINDTSKLTIVTAKAIIFRLFVFPIWMLKVEMDDTRNIPNKGNRIKANKNKKIFY